MQRGWIKLWRKMLDNPVLKRPAYKAVWIDLLLNANHEPGIKVLFGGEIIELEPGQFTAGSFQIGRRVGVPRGTVQRILETFKNEQMIEQRTDYQCSLITIKNWETYQKSEQGNEQRVSNGWVTGEQRVSTKQECKNVRMKECKKPPLPPKGGVGDNEDFELFWSVYPRRVARRSALQAWLKLKPDGEKRAAIFSALEHQKKCEQWTKNGGRFIPHAATWLNQERWKDEIEAQRSILSSKFDSLKKTTI